MVEKRYNCKIIKINCRLEVDVCELSTVNIKINTDRLLSMSLINSHVNTQEKRESDAICLESLLAPSCQLEVHPRESWSSRNRYDRCDAVELDLVVPKSAGTMGVYGCDSPGGPSSRPGSGRPCP